MAGLKSILIATIGGDGSKHSNRISKELGFQEAKWEFIFESRENFFSWNVGDGIVWLQTIGLEAADILAVILIENFGVDFCVFGVVFYAVLFLVLYIKLRMK